VRPNQLKPYLQPDATIVPKLAFSAPSTIKVLRVIFSTSLSLIFGLICFITLAIALSPISQAYLIKFISSLPLIA
jgi:hypothetical protein